MLINRTTNVGVDIPISKLQAHIHTKLTSTAPGWSYDGYYAYPRCYANNTKEGYIPEVFDEHKNNYTPLYVNDKIAALSFFGVGKEVEAVSAIQSEVDVHLIFMVDLNKIQPGNPREDELIRRTVYKIAVNAAWGFKLESVITGWNDVFAEYDGFFKTLDRFRDMHPYHVFRFNFRLRYNPIQC